ncbi:MAG TPA: hypothetical protein VFX59_13260 [Polyangiales bacterium]|nr:hypothetical protein [Polyangiales bacterium]
MKLRTGCAFALLVACGGDSGATGLRTQDVQAVCVDSPTKAPVGAWLCGQPRTVQCGEAVPPLYVTDDCGAYTLLADDVFLDQAGTQTVVVTRSNGTVACSSTLTVAGAAVPTLTPRTINLWPPNHKLHTITVEDCIGSFDSCDPDLRAEFSWASSDEPIDSIGDGHHAPDIVFDGCQRVQVRSERQGPKDGRVYKLGVRVTDGSGRATERTCAVIVDHDQRGVLGADSGEAYRIALDGTSGTPLCDGVNPPIVPPSVVTDAGPPVVGF